MSLRLTPTPHGYAMDLDIVGLLQGLNGQAAPAAPAAPASPSPAPVTHTPTTPPPATSRREQRRAARQAASTSQPKAAKRDNKALYAEITALSKTDPEAAARKAEGLGWQDAADRIRAKALVTQAAQRATQTMTRRAEPSGRKATETADAIADAILAAADQPKAETAKGRPASERCAKHNLFRNGQGVCKRCTAEAVVAAPPAPQPKAGKKGKGKGKPAIASTESPITQAVQAALDLSVQAEAFPGGLSESDLAIHWGNLMAQGQADMLRAALDACRKGVVAPGSTDQKVIWAKRSKTLQAILGLI